MYVDILCDIWEKDLKLAAEGFKKNKNMISPTNNA